MKERLATLISGGGTTMQEIIKACQSGEIPMDVACVISSNPTAGGIEKARHLGIPDKDIIVIDPNNFRGGDRKVDQYSFGQALLRMLRSSGATVVTQNGWLPLTPIEVITEYEGAIFNQHPGPLPETKGLHGTQPHSVILYLARQANGRIDRTEVIAQRVSPNFDEGAIVELAEIPLRVYDYPKELQKRALPIEHALQLKLLREFAAGTLRELPQRQPLLMPGEEHILFEARKNARKKYPKG